MKVTTVYIVGYKELTTTLYKVVDADSTLWYIYTYTPFNDYILSLIDEETALKLI